MDAEIIEQLIETEHQQYQLYIILTNINKAYPYPH